uniref:Putative terminase n=1 Tax=viral metagenome TaxID=1070528 RepID=A0A6M3IS04_9ZZZZ
MRDVADNRIASKYVNGNTKDKHSVKIKSITPVGEQMVYDIEMEEGGWDTRLKNGVYKQRSKARSPRDNFLIQGGLVSHNSCLIDEECSKDFFEEQTPRLFAADGDMLIAFTPVPGEIGWMFDDLYERARMIYRTKAVRDRIKERTGEVLPEIQITDSSEDVAVIMAATDDNPIYADLAKEKSEREGRPITATEYIDDMFSIYADEDVIDARRYGIFRRLSGKIFKTFNSKVHIIGGEKYFPDGLPHDWKHFRGIDWHESTPWAIGWIAVSPDDEIFVYNEFNPSPEKLITLEIARVVATRSQDYRFVLNLIDPLASKIQPNTGMSSLEDLNRVFAQFRRDGLGTGGFWQAWDTKSQKGRDEIRKRLANSVKVGMPFNNLVKQEGISRRLPTIWFLNNCVQTIQSMKNWRREEWQDRNKLQSKEEKETPQQRWSHFCTMLEGLMKRPEVFQARFGAVGGAPIRPKQYFNSRRG